MKRIVWTYAIAVIAIAGLLAYENGSREEKKMSWVDLPAVKVNAKPGGIWTWGNDWVEGPALIRIEATGTWRYSQSAGECTPDGDPASLLSARNTILPDAPVGSLLVKIGGGTAAFKDGKIFAAGQKAILQIDAGSSGPLLFTINDEPGGMSDNSGTVDVKIAVRKLQDAAPAPAPSQPPAQNQAAAPSGTAPVPKPAGGDAVHIPIPKAGS